MPRNRMIKTEFWNDEKMALVSRDARLTFIALWNLSDDYGSVRGHPLWLKNTIYPYDEIKPSDFKKWLEELEKIHAVLPYDGDGEKYYYIRCFTKHQVIGRPSQFRNPPPPATLIEDSLNNHGVLADETKRERESKTKRERESVATEEGLRLASFLFELIKKRNNGHKPPDMNKWGQEIDRMIRIDNRDPTEIEKVIEWCQADVDFWANNILCTEKLRKQYDQLKLKMESTRKEDIEAWIHR